VPDGRGLGGIMGIACGVMIIARPVLSKARLTNNKTACTANTARPGHRQTGQVTFAFYHKPALNSNGRFLCFMKGTE